MKKFERPVVLFDGACGVCSRWVPFWEPTLVKAGIDIAPLQTDGLQQQLGIADEELLKDVRLLLPDGTQLHGADAYFYCMRKIPWAFPLYVIFRMPGFQQLFHRCYRRFADNRYRISKVCRLPAQPTRGS